MLCKNCGSYVEHEWTECPKCKSYIHSENLELFIQEYKNFLHKKDYVKAKVILEKCIELTKFSSKNDIFVNQLNKLNKIIENKNNTVKEKLPNISKYTKQLIKNSEKISEQKKIEHPENDIPISSILYIILTVVALLILTILITQPKLFTSKYLYKKMFNIEKTFKTKPKKINLLDNEFNKKIEIKVINNSVNIDNNIIKDDKVIQADNQTISTSDNNNVILTLDKSVIIMEPNSKILITSFKQKQSKNITELNIIKGSIFFNVNKIKPDDTFNIITPIVSAGVRGTKFYIRQHKNFKIFCVEGKIHIKHNFNKQEIIIPENKSLNIYEKTRNLTLKNIPQDIIYKLDTLTAMSIDILYKTFNKNNYNFHFNNKPKINIKKINLEYEFKPKIYPLPKKKEQKITFNKKIKIKKPNFAKYKLNIKNQNKQIKTNSKPDVIKFIKFKYKQNFKEKGETKFKDDKSKIKDNVNFIKNDNSSFYKKTYIETKQTYSDTEIKKSETASRTKVRGFGFSE